MTCRYVPFGAWESNLEIMRFPTISVESVSHKVAISMMVIVCYFTPLSFVTVFWDKCSDYFLFCALS